MTRFATPARETVACRVRHSSRRTVRRVMRCAASARLVLFAATLGLSVNACADTASEVSLSQQAGDPAAAADRSGATYRVTFTGAWSDAATPGGVPEGAHFSPLIGAVHNAAVAFLEAGGAASPGIESMAERGRQATLREEIEAAGANWLSVLAKESGTGATDSATFEAVSVTLDHPRVTLLSMIAPSPDWFVGVFGLSLLDGEGAWVQTLAVDLFPWDAGTEEGDAFSFDNAATTPPGVITDLRGRGRFSDSPIATMTFTLSEGDGG